MMAEELGFLGVAAILLLYLVIVTYGVVIATRSNNHFGRLLGMGVTVTFFFHVFFNVAMVIGLIPIVGLPLPLISYGGSAMLSPDVRPRAADLRGRPSGHRHFAPSRRPRSALERSRRSAIWRAFGAPPDQTIAASTRPSPSIS